MSVFLFSVVASCFYMRGGLLAAWGFHASYNLSNYVLLVVASQIDYAAP